MKTTKSAEAKQKNDTVRHARLTCLVSDDEMRIIDGYLQKYGIEDRKSVV